MKAILYIRKFAFHLALILSFSCANSSAQSDTASYYIDKKFKDCINADGSTISIINCTTQGEKEWDQELKKYYELLLKTIATSEKELLRQSQRAWLLYKEKETKFLIKIYGNKEGSMWNIAVAERKKNITRQRAIELINYYETFTQH